MKLKVKDLEGKEHSFPSPMNVRIGKSHKSELFTKNGARMQAVIEVREEATLIDLGSTPQTAVNGKSVNTQVLKVGDKISIPDIYVGQIIVCEVLEVPDGSKSEAPKTEAPKTEVKLDPKLIEDASQEVASLVNNLFASTICTTKDIELFLHALLTISKESNNDQVLVRWAKLSIKELRGNVTGAFEAAVLRFIVDNEV